MGPPQVSTAMRWRIVGMSSAGMSLRQIGAQVGHHSSTISRILKKHRETNDVIDRKRSGRPRCTSEREDRALLRHVRRHPFAQSNALKRAWLPNRRICDRTVRNRLKAAGLRARRPVRRPLLTPAHKAARLQWCRDRRNWNLASWRKVHWSDESRFLLFMTDGRARVWRRRGTAYTQRNIMEQVPFGGGSLMVWGCFSYNCKLPLVTVRGNLNGVKYQRDILHPVVVPHFDNHPLRTRPVFMDDNARPHRSALVRDYLRQEAITTLPWPARSPDMNPIEHVWDIIGRRIRQRQPPVQNLAQLDVVLHQEWNQLPQRKLQHLVQSMRRRVAAVVAANGGYTRY
jgi:transposase